MRYLKLTQESANMNEPSLKVHTSIQHMASTDDCVILKTAAQRTVNDESKGVSRGMHMWNFLHILKQK